MFLQLLGKQMTEWRQKAEVQILELFACFVLAADQSVYVYPNE